MYVFAVYKKKKKKECTWVFSFAISLHRDVAKVKERKLLVNVLAQFSNIRSGRKNSHLPFFVEVDLRILLVALKNTCSRRLYNNPRGIEAVQYLSNYSDRQSHCETISFQVLLVCYLINTDASTHHE